MDRLWAWLLSLFTALFPIVSPPSASPPLVLQQSGDYLYEQQVIEDLGLLQLNTNLPSGEPADKLRQDHDCQFLTNAGFYDTANRHIGWLWVNGQEINPPQANDFLNGFLSISKTAAAITVSPDLTAAYGVQSGPLLILDNRVLKLKIRDDQPRRRVAAAITRSDQLIFLVILSRDSDYGGPLLADLPNLLKKINPEIKAAINLDGGSASAFINEKISLKEYSPIGGYFCYTKL